MLYKYFYTHNNKGGAAYQLSDEFIFSSEYRAYLDAYSGNSKRYNSYRGNGEGDVDVGKQGEGYSHRKRIYAGRYCKNKKLAYAENILAFFIFFLSDTTIALSEKQNINLILYHLG